MERLLTTTSHVVPTLSDRPNRSRTCIVYRPCDCSHHPSQLSHSISDTPATCRPNKLDFLTSKSHTHIQLIGSTTAIKNYRFVSNTKHWLNNYDNQRQCLSSLTIDYLLFMHLNSIRNMLDKFVWMFTVQ